MDKKEIQEHQNFPCNQWFQFGKKTFLQLQTKIKKKEKLYQRLPQYAYN